jgi:hypothetical protein
MAAKPGSTPAAKGIDNKLSTGDASINVLVQRFAMVFSAAHNTWFEQPLACCLHFFSQGLP